jgi:hypothetical protein
MPAMHLSFFSPAPPRHFRLFSFGFRWFSAIDADTLSLLMPLLPLASPLRFH